jgi:hypothetical protein
MNGLLGLAAARSSIPAGSKYASDDWQLDPWLAPQRTCREHPPIFLAADRVPLAKTICVKAPTL